MKERPPIAAAARLTESTADKKEASLSLPVLVLPLLLKKKTPQRPTKKRCFFFPLSLPVLVIPLSYTSSTPNRFQFSNSIIASHLEVRAHFERTRNLLAFVLLLLLLLSLSSSLSAPRTPGHGHCALIKSLSLSLSLSPDRALDPPY